MVATAGIELRGPVGLDAHGLAPSGVVHWNPTTSLLYSHALLRGEAWLAEGGPLVVDTGEHTGRSPLDKFVVREPGSEERIAWGTVNQPFEEDRFEGLRGKIVALPRRAGRLRRGRVRRGGSGASPRAAGRDVQPVARALREDAVHRPDRRASCGATSRRRSCSTRRPSRPIRRRTARARGRSSSSIPLAPRC